MIFTNNSIGAGGIARQIAELYLRDQFTEPSPPIQERPQGQQRTRDPRPEPITLTSVQLREYSGVYYSDELDAYATLSLKNNKPVIKLGTSSGNLVTYSSNNFGWRRSQIEFIRDSFNKITGFVLSQVRGSRIDFRLEFTRI